MPRVATPKEKAAPTQLLKARLSQQLVLGSAPPHCPRRSRRRTIWLPSVTPLWGSAPRPPWSLVDPFPISRWLKSRLLSRGHECRFGLQRPRPQSFNRIREKGKEAILRHYQKFLSIFSSRECSIPAGTQPGRHQPFQGPSQGRHLLPQSPGGWKARGQAGM